MYVERLLPIVGIESKPFRQTVHAKDIINFADAVGATDPIYHDLECAKNTPYGTIIAPPTFTVSLQCHPIEGLWIAPAGRILASQEFIYHKPILAEHDYIVRTKIKEAYEKTGKNGVMVFTVEEKTAYDLDMNPCVTYLMTVITRGSIFDAHDRELENQTIDITEEVTASNIILFDDLTVGMELPPITIPPFTKVNLSKYAGVSRDFNAIHLDDEAAKKLKFKGVVVYGLLSMASQGSLLSQWFGSPENFFMTNFKTKFISPTYVGEIPTYSAVVTNIKDEERLAEFEFCMKRADDSIIIRGTFSIQFP